MKCRPTEKTIEIAKQMYFEGFYYKDISVKTGMSISSLQKHAFRQDWPRHHGYLKNQWHKKKEKKVVEKKAIEAPLADESSMVDCCRRLMWLIENDQCLY